MQSPLWIRAGHYCVLARREESSFDRIGDRSDNREGLLSAAMLRTLGIDLAAQPKDTAYCAMRSWGLALGARKTPVLGASDAALLDEMQCAAWTGIDAPFGWPEAFCGAIGRYITTAEWPDRPGWGSTPAPNDGPLRARHHQRGTRSSGRATVGVLELDRRVRVAQRQSASSASSTLRPCVRPDRNAAGQWSRWPAQCQEVGRTVSRGRRGRGVSGRRARGCGTCRIAATRRVSAQRHR